MDTVSGEQIAYQYDSLKRLSAATSTSISTSAPLWGQTFAYDGFGNLTDMNPTGTGAPALHQTVAAATNHIDGTGYDLNGNTLLPNATYDVENRFFTYGENYVYGPDNKRVYRANSNLPELALYGLDGKLLALMVYPT